MTGTERKAKVRRKGGTIHGGGGLYPTSCAAARMRRPVHHLSVYPIFSFMSLFNSHTLPPFHICAPSQHNELHRIHSHGRPTHSFHLPARIRHNHAPWISSIQNSGVWPAYWCAHIAAATRTKCFWRARIKSSVGAGRVGDRRT